MNTKPPRKNIAFPPRLNILGNIITILSSFLIHYLIESDYYISIQIGKPIQLYFLLIFRLNIFPLFSLSVGSMR